VETQIFYAAIFPGQEKVVFNQHLLDNADNCFADLLPDYAQWQTVIKVIDPSRTGQELWVDADMQTQTTVSFFVSHPS